MSALAMPFDQRAENLDPPDDRDEIDAKRPVPSRVSPSSIWPAATHARVVDENMHLAITGDRGVGRRVKLGLERNVGLACARAPAMPSPIPDAAPVTNAVLPARSFIPIS